MSPTAVVVLIVAIAVIAVVVLLRGQGFELFLGWWRIGARVKAEPQSPKPNVEDEKSPGVVFKGNKLRGEGEYRMRNTEFSENDVDGTQQIELGYDEPSSQAQSEEP